MTNEEARTNVTAFIIAKWKDIPEKVIEALDVFRQANEKQIPKKPKIEGGGVGAVFVCPCCHRLFDFVRLRNFINEFEYYRYCEDCGQAIDWSEEE